MSNFVITGAAGFIGSRIATQLLDQGHTVHGIDNLSDYYDPQLKTWRLQKLLVRANFSFDLLDIEIPTDVTASIKKRGLVDGVFHLAARAGVRTSVAEPRAYYQTNLLGTLNILEACRLSKVAKLVVASSSSVYGDCRDMPYLEDSCESKPLSPYAASKKATEDLCYTYHHLHGLDISALRFFTVYGPAGRPDMGVFRFIKGIVEGETLTMFGDGNQSRDFSYVDDIARGAVLALKPVGFRVFNLGANRPVTVRRAIQIIEDLSGRTAKINQQPQDASDVLDTWASISRASAELGWQPAISVEIGLQRAYEWYLANRSWVSKLGIAKSAPFASSDKHLLQFTTDLLGLNHHTSAPAVADQIEVS